MHRTINISVSVADLFAAAWLVGGALNIAFVAHWRVDPGLVWRWVAVAAVYVAVRLLGRGRDNRDRDRDRDRGGCGSHKSGACGRPLMRSEDVASTTQPAGANFGRDVSIRAVILRLLAAAGVWQATVAVGQHVGWIASNHRMFDVTGNFGNPGQLGGFLAVCLVATAATAKTVATTKTLKPDKKRWQAAVATIAGVAILAGLWLADSRAAWVAVAVGLIVVWWRELADRLRLRAKIVIPIAIAIIAIAGILLFNHRPASAQARLLVWRVSAGMIADAPLAGHGVGAFEREYMLRQAAWFEAHPDSRLEMVADNVAYPYNELLHVLLEQGAVGLLLLLGLFWAVFAGRTGGGKTPADEIRDNRESCAKEARSDVPIDENKQGLRAALAALVAFSMFSYPSYIFGLLILFPLLTGALESRTAFALSLPRWTWVAFAMLAVAVGVAGGKELCFRGESLRQARALFSRENAAALRFVDRNYNHLRYNHDFTARYAAWLAVNHDDSVLMGRMLDLPPSCERWCDIGRALTGRGCYGEAERYLRTAALMIPTRLTPNYLLWKLHLVQGDGTRTALAARRLLAQPLKVENTFTLRAKAEARRYLANDPGI
ncbi:ligase [Bacteroidia bacterium]|nr:ligase [Bacteroidia bacterium]